MTWRDLERATPVVRGVPVDIADEELWANDEYAVTKRVMKSNEEGQPDAIHLSIRRQDRLPCRDWRDFQRIKNQLAGPEWEAMEIYPAESRMVDMANQYHLWCFPFYIGVGFNQGRMISNQFQTSVVTPGAVQRDPEKVDLRYGGLTSMKELKEKQDTTYGRPLQEG